MKLKPLNTHPLRLVHYGKECPFFISTLSDSEILSRLERNESYVYWFQPPHSAKPSDLLPALCINNTFYTPSLRVMKALWRHVRLKKDFKNIERSHTGGFKLKIPTALWMEKKRTQLRFHVSFILLCFITILIDTICLSL